MSKVLITESNLTAIANAIRGRNGSSNTYKPGQMAAAITAIPNSYAAGDEGKVVDNGALVAQSSLSVNENGTYDTTKKNSVTVLVSGGNDYITPDRIFSSDGWYLSSGGALYYDSSDTDDTMIVWPVQASHDYLVVLGGTVGNRLTVSFFTQDIASNPVSETQGTRFNTISNSDIAAHNAKPIHCSAAGWVAAYISYNLGPDIRVYLLDVTNLA